MEKEDEGEGGKQNYEAGRGIKYPNPWNKENNTQQGP
jgi:hypothetical protein